MNFCADGGYLVDGKTPIPDDPTDHCVDRLPIVACNRLRCPTCGAMVRSAPGVALESREVSLAAVHDAPDLATAPGVVSTLRQFRLYLCRDAARLEKDWHRLDERDPDVKEDLGVAWRCAGHPLVELPHVFDGVPVAGEAELVAIVRRSASGWVPDGASPAFKIGARWLARLYHWLAGTRWQEFVAQAALALLDDPDPRTRAYAIQFFILAPSVPALRRVLEILEGDRAGFAGVRDEVTTNDDDPTLEHSLWRILHDTIERNERARQLARKEALTPGKGGRSVYMPLARWDTDWLLEHAADIVRANPAMAEALLKSGEFNFPPAGPYLTLLENVRSAQAKA